MSGKRDALMHGIHRKVRDGSMEDRGDVHRHERLASSARDLWESLVEGSPAVTEGPGDCPVCSTIKSKMESWEHNAP